jgi:TatD DNase family protein
MYISFWFDFIIRPESRDLLRTLPVDRIFLETDGSGAGIMSIYEKVSDDLGLKTEQLKNQIYSNFMNFFNI